MPSIAETFAAAFAHHQAGNPHLAEPLYEQVIQADPGHADAHHLLGVCAYQLGHYDLAISSIRTALELNPGAAAYHSNLGAVQGALGQLAEAAASYQQAIRLQPDYAEAHHNLANVLFAIGNALATTEKLNEAATRYREVLEVRPDYAEAYNNLANVLERQDKLEEAIYFCRQALRLKPDYAQAYYNMGNTLERLDELDEVVRCYRQALHLKPDFAEAHNNLGSILLRLGQVDDALICFREALRLDPGLEAAQDNLLSGLNYDAKVKLDECFEAHRRWGEAVERRASQRSIRAATARERHGGGAEEAAPWRSRLRTDRLRIGYVSPDLRFHPITRYLEPVVAYHDRQAFEVCCYAEVPRPDAVTVRLQKMVHSWRWTCGLTDNQVAEMIQRDQIDILVDLAGHTPGNRLRVFSRKPAPVQATWLGYMNTTGLASIDYRLTDSVLDPPDESPVRDTEQLIRLPNGMCCFAPPADAPAIMPLPVAKRRQLTFGSLSSLFKINNHLIDLWSQVLKAVPNSRLLLFHHTLTGLAAERIHGQFNAHGVRSDRLDLRRGHYGPGYLGVYAEIDVSLDTFPYSGGVTTCESLWMGVPVLSLRGETRASRNAAAVLARVGMADWALQTPEQYVALAAKWADNVDQLAELRVELRDRMMGTLCDGRRFTRELEETYRTLISAPSSGPRPGE
jgi:predicted O-linked N-acetylglucosamine transferase (SPINDLY family)